MMYAIDQAKRKLRPRKSLTVSELLEHPEYLTFSIKGIVEESNKILKK